MLRYRGKQMSALVLAATLGLGLCACGNSNRPASASTELGGVNGQGMAVGDRNKAASIYPYVAEGVALPPDFDNMVLPIIALMLQDYGKGYEYYYSDVDPGQEDSVWYSMAALNSMLNAAGKGVSEKNEEDGYWYMDKDAFDMCMSALYDEYGCGYLDIPMLSASDTYAVYNEAEDRYGFIEGDAGGLYPFITECTDEDGSYNMLIELRRDTVGGEPEVLREMYFDIYENSYVSSTNIFPYSISDAYRTDVIEEMDDAYSDDDEEIFDVDDDGSDSDSSDNGSTPTSTNPGSSGRENSGNSFFDPEVLRDIDTSGGNISLDDAQYLAQIKYGSSQEYIYQGMETVDEETYYIFATSGNDDVYVFIHESGQDAFAGVRNVDGSWDFRE